MARSVSRDQPGGKLQIATRIGRSPGDANATRLRRQILTSSSPMDESVRLADKGLLDPPARRDNRSSFLSRGVAFFVACSTSHGRGIGEAG
jgi:hypothetical protein